MSNTMLKVRQYRGDEDLQPICDLINLCDDTDKLDEGASVADLRVWIERPDRDKARDIRIWEDADGRMLAVGQILMPPGGEEVDGFFYFRAHPEARNQGVETEIIDWGAERLREVATERGLPGYLRTGTRDFDTYGRSIFESNGFEIARYFLTMRRTLDQPIPAPQLPEGFTLRHVDANDEADIARWVEMYNLSFIDHWGFHPATLEHRKHRMTSPSYKAERDLVAVSPDGTFAAFCLCLIDAEDNARKNRNDGWIGVLGTRRGFRKIGLGRAMLLAGLRKLREDGVDTAVLDVDAENPTGALGLYEAAGFTTTITDVSYSKRV